MKILDLLMIAVILAAVDRVDSDSWLDISILSASVVWLICFVLRMVKKDD